MEKINPCLWFNNQAGEAAAYYCKLFPDAEITTETQVVVEFTASGHKFTCLNGGPKYQPNPSISFFYLCESADEIEELWNEILKDGKALMPLQEYPWSKKYGWVQDKYGISWQLSWVKMDEAGQKITPSLLFTQDQNGRAEEALKHYTTIFKDAVVDGVLYNPEDKTLVQHAQFSLNGQKFMMMDGGKGHDFTFNEGISFMIICETQDEIDYYWEKLTAGGEESMCGWLKDKFGVSWQVVPRILSRLMNDHERSERVMKAFMTMKKFNIEQLINA